jgi:hypothetical protein
MNDEQQKEAVKAIVERILQRIETPLEVRYGGETHHLLLGHSVRCAIEAAAQSALAREFAEQGPPEKGIPDLTAPHWYPPGSDPIKRTPLATDQQSDEHR